MSTERTHTLRTLEEFESGCQCDRCTQMQWHLEQIGDPHLTMEQAVTLNVRRRAILHRQSEVSNECQH